MGLLFKIVGGIGIGIFFLLMVFSTFSQNTHNVGLPDFPDFSQSNFSSGAINSHYISGLETLYTLDESYQFTDSNLKIEDNTQYISSFRDVKEEYSFSWTWFTLTQKSAGDVYIDTLTTPGKVFIYAMNSPLTLSLHNDDASEKYVDIELAAHMYLEFQANRGRFLKNADRLRISTVFKLWYIWNIGEYSISQWNIRKYYEGDNDFFTLVFQDIQKNDMQKNISLENFSNQDIYQITRFDFIQRYIHLFVNIEKKKVFYKNLILSWYKKLLVSQKIDEGIVRNIKKDLETLKSIDEDSYREMLDLQNTLISLVYSSNSQQFIISKLAFALLEDSDISTKKLYYPLYSFALFSSYDQKKEFSSDLSNKLIESFVSPENTQDNQAWRNQYDYFLYYLERQLLFLLTSSKENNTINHSSIFSLLDKYASITSSLEYLNTTQKVTRLFVISQILKNIDIFIRSEYFQAQRNDDGILILNSSKQMSQDNLRLLQKSITLLNNIFSTDKALLDSSLSRDISISQDIKLHQIKLTEYLAALENYGSYQEKYDTSKNALLSLDTFSNAQDTSLSLEKINAYLSQFKGVSLNGADIEVFDTYYKVNRILISGRVFSFEIYPASQYRLWNIQIDEREITSQYKLSFIQSQWEELFKTAINEEKEKFDFTKFFLLTFFQWTSENIEEYVVPTQQIQESKAEVVFKKDILLGKNGEFESILNNIKIEYQDVTLKQAGINYDIFLDDVDFIVRNTLKTNSQSINWKLFSEYILNDQDHYFKDIQLLIESDSQGQERDYIFDANRVFVSGKIFIWDIQEQLQEAVNDIFTYVPVYSQLTDIVPADSITLQYTLFNKKLSLKFDYKGKKYNILLKQWQVESIYKWTKKIVSWAIANGELSNYIQ